MGASGWEVVWSVAIGDLDSDGDLDIVAENYDKVIAYENDGSPFSGLWSPNVVGARGDYVTSVALGDLDLDGDLDIVSGFWSGAGIVVSVWQNDGSPFSGLWSRSDVSTGGWADSVALGDLDNDGDLDIVSGFQPEIWPETTYRTFSSISEDFQVIAWENNGSPFSGLWSPREVGASTTPVGSVALGDLDNDGDLDIVSGSYSDEDYEVIAWQNTLVHRNMRFGPGGSDAGASADDVRSVVLGDLDSDGDLDMVSGSGLAEDHEVIAWDNGGSPFSGLWPQHDVGTSIANVISVALGDLDDDGDVDIVSGSGWGEDYEVVAWQNDGSPFSGLWAQNDVGASTDHVMSVALGDLDDDGDLDIVSGSQSGEDYEVIAWQNDGSPFSGLWSQNDVGASTDHVMSVALGDLDDDGDLDIVSGGWPGEDYEVIAWQNDGSPFSGVWSQHDVGASTDVVFSVALGDLDNDGDLDIVSGSFYFGEDYEVMAWDNDGSPFTGFWPQNDVGASTSNVRSVALGDLDNDGDLDIVCASDSGEDYEVIAWQNDSSPFTGLWAQSDLGASTDSVLSVALGDLDHDGDLDVVSGSHSGAEYELLAWWNRTSDCYCFLPLAERKY